MVHGHRDHHCRMCSHHTPHTWLATTSTSLVVWLLTPAGLFRSHFLLFLWCIIGIYSKHHTTDSAKLTLSTHWVPMTTSGRQSAVWIDPAPITPPCPCPTGTCSSLEIRMWAVAPKCGPTRPRRRVSCQAPVVNVFIITKISQINQHSLCCIRNKRNLTEHKVAHTARAFPAAVYLNKPVC